MKYKFKVYDRVNGESNVGSKIKNGVVAYIDKTSTVQPYRVAFIENDDLVHVHWCSELDLEFLNKPKTKEMTVAEIEKELGYTIKVVK